MELVTSFYPTEYGRSDKLVTLGLCSITVDQIERRLLLGKKQPAMFETPVKATGQNCSCPLGVGSGLQQENRYLRPESTRKGILATT